MSISEFFNRKSRAVVAAIALAFGAGAGYVGHETAQAVSQPQASSFTLAQLSDNENVTEAEFFRGKLNTPAPVDPLQAPTIAEFQARIDGLAQRKAEMLALPGHEQPVLMVRLVQDSSVMIGELRMNTHLSERDYGRLVDDYNARVGIDVSPWTGNYAKGIMYQQDAAVGAAFSNFFGDEDLTDADLSRVAGEAMAEGQKLNDRAGLLGGLGGAALGGLLMVPLWRRRNHPQVPKAKPPKR
ncbi:MAG TPA: hypothetical protein VEF76_07970 [Patescibacteria group bacterium]|nr:hypothetical protein [Patescibacteria group bacterium]